MNENNNLNGSVLGNVGSSPDNNMANNLGVESLEQPVPSPTPVTPSPMPAPGEVPVPEVTPTETPASSFFGGVNQNVTPGPVGPTEPVGNGGPTEPVPPQEVPPMPNPEPLNNPAPVSPEQVAPTPVVPTPTPMPEPAYTNPNTINPGGSMPGFESSSTIGTTPPLSLEPEVQPQKKTNKTLFIIIVLVVLVGVGFGTFYVLKYTNLVNKKVAKVSIVPKNIEVYLGAELPQNNNEYATVTGTDISSCTVDKTKVDTSKVGEYKYTITCGETHREGTVTVTEGGELTVELKQVVKKINDPLEAKEFAVDSTDLTFEFVEEETVKANLGTAGTYPVKLKVTDKYSRTKEVEGELVVVEYSIKGYLICSKEEDMAAIGAKKTTAERFAIADINGTNSNDFANMAYEDATFTYTSDVNYQNLKTKYNTDKTVTIDTYSGAATFDDNAKSITFSKDLVISELENTIGKDNLAKYGTIRSYYEGQGYSCIYRKAETTQTETTN